MAPPASPSRPSTLRHPPAAHPGDVCGGKRPHFFKVFFPCYSSKRLGIPPGFWKHIEHEASKSVSLIAPSGNVWNVDLVRHKDGGFSFQNGWRDFVADHNLQTGDFLLFRYDGKLCFTVAVFDPTACEREDSFHVRPSEDVIVLGESRPTRDATKCLAEDLIILDPQTDTAIHSKIMGMKETPLEMTCQDFVKKHTDSVGSHSEEIHNTCNGAMVTNEDNMDCCRKQDSMVVSQASTLSLGLQSELAEPIGTNSSKGCECILLGKCGVQRRIIPQCSFCRDPLNSRRCPLWKQTAQGHLDKVSCAVKEELQSDEDVNNVCSGQTMLKDKRITKMKADKSRNVCGGDLKDSAQKHEKLAVKCLPHKKNRSSKRQPCFKCSRSSADSEINSVIITVRMGFAVSRRRPITEYDKTKALEAAMLFQSEHPYGICVMQESNVYYGYYLCLPSSFVRHLPKSDLKMKLWDPSNEPWKVMYVHWEGRGGFSAGWGKFVRAHNLESEDVCVFELLKPNEVCVHIFRVVEEIVPLIWSDCRKTERIFH